MEYISQLCELGKTFPEAEALCINETLKSASALVGTDYLRFREEFPTPEGPSNVPSYLIENEQASPQFVKDKTARENNSVIQLLEEKKDTEGIEKDIAEYLLEPDKEHGPGDISPVPSPRRGPGAISPGRTLTIIDLWDTTRYSPWMTKPSSEDILIRDADELGANIGLLNNVVDELKDYTTKRGAKYPFGEKIDPQLQIRKSNFLLSLLNVITGIYTREEYALLYITQICYTNGKAGRKRERDRQARVLSHNRLPRDSNGDLAKFDEYNGDWRGLRAVVCLINMQPQEEVEGKTDPLDGEKELAGSHWVALIFTTGEEQDVSVGGLETRIRKENRNPAKERRMYMIDPYISYETIRITGRDEYKKTEEYADRRMKTLNRATWQCYRAGILSSNVIASSGYSPASEGSSPHKVGLYADIISPYGLLDFYLSYSITEDIPDEGSEIYYDRKVLITGTGSKEQEAEEAIQKYLEKLKKRGLVGRKWTMVVETLYPSCTMLYETPFLWIVPYSLVSTIQALIISDVQRDRKARAFADLFPYTTTEIFYAMSRLSRKGKTSERIYETSKRYQILAFPTFYSPFRKLKDLYEQVTIPVFASNMVISFVVMKALYEMYSNVEE